MEKLITQSTNLMVCKPFTKGVCDLVLRKRDLQRMSKAIVPARENINVMCNGHSGASDHTTCAYRILLHRKVPLLPTFGSPPRETQQVRKLCYVPGKKLQLQTGRMDSFNNNFNGVNIPVNNFLGHSCNSTVHRATWT